MAMDASTSFGEYMGTNYDARNTKRNVVVFGSSGKGKSSVINLLANQPIAKVSDGAYSCTEKPQCYEFTACYVWDTCGYPDDPAALAKTLRLIRYLKKGVSLLIMVSAKGRTLEDEALYYRIVYEFMCSNQVPSMLVVTRCETNGNGQVNDWVNTNRKALQTKFPGLSSACICGISTQFESEYPEVVRDAESGREMLLSIIVGVLGMNVPPFVYKVQSSPKVQTPMLEAMVSSVMGNKTDTVLVAGLIKAGLKRDDAENLATAMETPDAQYFNRPASAAPAAAPAPASRSVAQAAPAGQSNGQFNGQSPSSAQGQQRPQQRPVAATVPANVPANVARPFAATVASPVPAPFAPTRANSSPAGSFAASTGSDRSRNEQFVPTVASAVAPGPKPVKPQHLSSSPAAVSVPNGNRSSAFNDPLSQPASRAVPTNEDFYPSVPSLITGNQASARPSGSSGFSPTAADVRYGAPAVAAPAKEDPWGDVLVPTRAAVPRDDFVATTPATAPANYQYQNQQYQYQQQQYRQQQQAEGKAVQRAGAAYTDPLTLFNDADYQRQQQGRTTYAADGKQSDPRYTADGKHGDQRAPAKSYK